MYPTIVIILVSFTETYTDPTLTRIVALIPFGRWTPRPGRHIPKPSQGSTSSDYTEVSFALPPVIHINPGTAFALGSTSDQDEEPERRFSAPDRDDVAKGGEDEV